MKRISIAKTFIIILSIVIVLFISGSYLMGETAEKKINYTVRQFSDKGLNVKTYDKGIFSSSIVLSLGSMEVAKVKLIHMPVIISSDNLFNKFLFIFEALGKVELFNKNSKVSTQELLVNLNGDIDTRFKVFLPKFVTMALKNFNAQLPDDAVEGSLLINASDPKVIKAKLKSNIDIEKLSSNMLLPVKFNINNASLDLDLYFEKSKTSDEINNKTKVTFTINNLFVPAVKTSIDSIILDVKLEPQSISPSLVVQTFFTNPLNFLNLVNTNLSVSINNLKSLGIKGSNNQSSAEKIQLNLSLNGTNENFESKFKLFFKEINSFIFSTKKSDFNVEFNINKNLLFFELPHLIQAAKYNKLNLTENQINQYLSQIQKVLISYDIENFQTQGNDFGTLDFDKIYLMYGLNNKHKNLFLKNEFYLKNLKWLKTPSSFSKFSGKLGNTNASIKADFNLSNLFLGRNTEMIYEMNTVMPEFEVSFPKGKFDMNKLVVSGKGSPSSDTSNFSINNISYNNIKVSDVTLDSKMNNLSSFTYGTLMSKLIETYFPEYLNSEDKEIYSSKIASETLIYLIKKGFDIKQNFSVKLDSFDDKKVTSNLKLMLKPNVEDNISTLTSNQLSELIFKNTEIQLDLKIPSFLYKNIQEVIIMQINYLPESFQNKLPKILEEINKKSIVQDQKGYFSLKFNYYNGKLTLNGYDIQKLIEKENSKPKLNKKDKDDNDSLKNFIKDNQAISTNKKSKVNE